MAEYLIQEETLKSIADAVRIKSEKTEPILISDLPNEIKSLNITNYILPTLNPNYPSDVTTTVIKGDTKSATFYIDIIEAGIPAIYTYQWYVNNIPVDGATNSTFTKSDLSETGTYEVYCEVTNRAGVIKSRVATLNVTQYYTPVLNSEYPKDTSVTVIKGNTTNATFNVVIDEIGVPDLYTYQWYKDGVAVDGETNPTYTANGLSETGTHRIYCAVTNDAGTVTSRMATLNVTQYYKPVLDSSYPKDASVTVVKGNKESKTFSVTIDTDGVPSSYTYQWYVNDVAVEGANGSSYTKSDLSETAIYTIYCKVTNAAGSVNSRVATLSVTQYYMPTLNSSYPANATVVVKNSITSKVEIATAGNPNSYSYQWYKNGSVVSGATSSTYTFTPTEIGTTTLYCKVSNAAGTVTSRTATIKATGVYLYNAGDECTEITGGWITAKRTHRSGANTYDQGEASIVKDGNGTVTFTSDGLRGVIYYCKNKISLKNFNTIHFEGTMEGKNADWVGFYVWTSLDSYIRSNYAALIEGNRTNFDLDVSGLTGDYYIGFGIYSTNEKVVMKSLEMR